MLFSNGYVTGLRIVKWEKIDGKKLDDFSNSTYLLVSRLNQATKKVQVRVNTAIIPIPL